MKSKEEILMDALGKHNHDELCSVRPFLLAAMEIYASQFQPPPDIEKWIEDEAAKHTESLLWPESYSSDTPANLTVIQARTLSRNSGFAIGKTVYSLLHSQRQKELEEKDREIERLKMEIEGLENDLIEER